MELNNLTERALDTHPVSVSELNRLLRETLEHTLPLLWVEGEVSGWVRAASGHVYFSLKDASAQVRCVMWRARAQLLSFAPQNGMRVSVRALVTVYEARADLQLVVESMRPAGEGDLHEAFVRLKAKLAAEGLFDVARKRSIPLYPRAIGLVTSSGAAALQDVLATLAQRAPHIPVFLYPSTVQGVAAGVALRAALEKAQSRVEADLLDVILLVRGGGNIEDLNAFNDESLVRQIIKSPVAVVSGVGHEIDFTLADFAADLRAATPTAAALLVSEGFFAARGQLQRLTSVLQQSMRRYVEYAQQNLDYLSRCLVHPHARLALAEQKMWRLQERLIHSRQQVMQRFFSPYEALWARLLGARPGFDFYEYRLLGLSVRLQQCAFRGLERKRHALNQIQTGLLALDPRAVLRRGYAIVRTEQGSVIREADEVLDRTPIEIELKTGVLYAITYVPSSKGVRLKNFKNVK